MGLGQGLGPIAAAGKGGALLTLTHYWPGVAEGVGTTSTTLSDLDATNLTATFIVPPSGAVLVRLSATTFTASGTTTYTVWGLREGAATLPNTESRVYRGAVGIRCSLPIYVAGLTPGDTKTWKWGVATTVAGENSETQFGANRGPGVMEVWAA